MKKKIAIIFPANSMNRIYSVAGVLVDQAKMLAENGYQVTIQDPYQQKQAVLTPLHEKVFRLPFKNAKAIYLNQSDRQSIADYFCISPEDVLFQKRRR